MAITIASLKQASEFEATFFRLLEEEGLNDEVPGVLVNDRKARQQAVLFLNTLVGSSGATPNYQSARDILGDDIIFPWEIAEAYYGVSYTEAQLAHLAQTLPEKRVLQWARDNGFAVVAGPPSEMSLPDIHELNMYLFHEMNDAWFANTRQKFAHEDTVGTSWLIVRKELVPNSTPKTWSEQQALLSENERVPNVAEAAWFFTTYAKVRGIYLVPNVYVRTSSVISDGRNVQVGCFFNNSLRVAVSFPNGRYGNTVVDGRFENVGVASAWK